VTHVPESDLDRRWRVQTDRCTDPDCGTEHTSRPGPGRRHDQAESTTGRARWRGPTPDGGSV